MSSRPYAYAVALHSGGRHEEAMPVLKDTLRNLRTIAIFQALASFSWMAGDAVAALGYAERLATMAPSGQDVAARI